MMGCYILSGAEPDELWPLIKAHHYSRRMPSNIQHCYAMREKGGLLGDTGAVVAGVIYSIPPTRWSEEVLELSRLVRLPSCAAKLSQLIAYSTAFLKRAKWNLLVSFADKTQGHEGFVYQASGWNYDGCRERRMDGVIYNGVFVPGRSSNSRWGTRSPSRLADKGIIVQPHYDEGKHLYWKPLHNSGASKAKRIGLTSVAYPKNAACRMDELVPSSASQAQPLEAAP